MTGGHKLTFFTKERRIVDGEQHTHGRFVHFDSWKWLWVFGITDGVTDFKTFNTCNGAEIARLNLRYLSTFDTFKNKHFFDAVLFLAASLALEMPVLPGRRRVAMGAVVEGDGALPPVIKKKTKLVSKEKAAGALA